jgi:hypothetical protein
MKVLGSGCTRTHSHGSSMPGIMQVRAYCTYMCPCDQLQTLRSPKQAASSKQLQQPQLLQKLYRTWQDNFFKAPRTVLKWALWMSHPLARPW